MKLTIDTDKRELICEEADQRRHLELYSKEAFELMSRQWLKVGWDQKYPYTFSWFGRPIIQLPEDMVRVQEVLYRIKPDVIIETGVAHGGSLVFYAGLCKAIGRGRVIGVDIEIREPNRRAIEQHEVAPLITLIEGDSTNPAVIARVKSLVRSGERGLVVLDSCHTKEHVLKELEAYKDLVSPDSYLIATDGSMQDLHDVPRGEPEWAWNNPAAAVREFAARHPEFTIEQPVWPFNESPLSVGVTHWSGAWLRRNG